MGELDHVGSASLPWERTGPPSGVGICISGGGLRAAAFHLGALQTLQENRRLLYGPDCADVLASVSGGSYIAAAHTLAASRAQPGDVAPFSPGSPEERHVTTNARYLVADGPFKTALRFGGPILLTVMATVALIVWTAVVVGNFANVIGLAYDVPEGRYPWWAWAAAAVAVIAARLAVGWFWTDEPLRRFVLFFVAGAIATLLTPFLVGGLSRIGFLSDWGAWSIGWWWLLAIPATAALAALPILVPRLLGSGVPGYTALRIARALGTWAPITSGLILTSIITVKWTEVFDFDSFDDMTEGESVVLLISFFTVLFGALIWSQIVDKLPLHQPYRELLARCFAVHRDGDGVKVHAGTDVTLSELEPPAGDGRFPRLLVCATANVKWTDSNGRKQRFAPYVFSHDRCGVPGVPGANDDSSQLELDRTTIGLLNPREVPTVSLFGAVAASGAAVSPSMGAMTATAVRPLIATLGVRLGLWVSNPLWHRARARVAVATEPRRIYREKKLGYGFDHLFQELLGLHTWRSAQVYVTDGGHYDNLGLIALLRARCADIWCFDAQADSKGSAQVVKGVLRRAAEEMAITHDLDLDAFATVDGVMPVTHVKGTITHADGATTSITVVKLGLHHTSPAELLSRRVKRRFFGGTRRWSFPTHPTFMQVFDEDRMRAYQALGRDAAQRALGA